MLSLDEKYNNFKDCILKCSYRLLDKSDEEIVYTIFEDLSIDINSFVHPNTLDLLLSEGMINPKIYWMSVCFRKKFIDLEKNTCNVNDIRDSVEWKCLFALSDKISLQLYF